MSTQSTQSRELTKLPLTPDQQAVAEELRTKFLLALESDITALAQLLSTKTDATFFGATEFQIRDLVMGMGAKALETAVASKKSELCRLLAQLPALPPGSQVPSLATLRRVDRAGADQGRAALLLLCAMWHGPFASGQGHAPE